MLPEITSSIALLQSTVKTVLKAFNFQMLPETTIIHCFIAIDCQEGYLNHFTFKCLQKLSIALLQFTIKTVLKTFNIQMLPEITIIHCFITVYCQNRAENISNEKVSNAYKNYNYPLLYCNFLSKRY